ncbi:MAG: hypothetical protein JO202_03530 [Ktedonobacteraceae bacterium]|nr:hypothetical protein [Ktedonobacteraceae bacterium]
MTSTTAQKPTCPVCHQADQVKTTQAAYDAGVERCAPPDMPTKNVPLFLPFLLCMVFVGFFVFAIVILIGSEATLSLAFQYVLVGLTLICIIAALVVSYMAFQSVVKGDAEATKRFPAWDRAMAVWRSLYYCARNDVIFDPKTNKVLSNEELLALRSMQEDRAEQISATLVQQQ